MPAKALVDRVSDYLGLPPQEVANIAARAPTSYRLYAIPKKKGGQRIIFHPARTTKAIQYALFELLLKHLPVHEAAVGYIRGLRSPTRHNAERHAKYAYSIRLDIQDFFPSLQPRDLTHAFTTYLADPTRILSTADYKFLERALFVKYPRASVGLAVGAPSSPALSNALMHEIDKALSDYANTLEGLYTRYADDLVFSSDRKGACKQFQSALQKHLRETKHPRLRLNRKKTVLMSRGTRRAITGLIVTPTGVISLGRQQKRYVRKLLFDLARGVLSDSGQRYLQGFLAYSISVEPEFLNRLVLKYGGQLIHDALDHRWLLPAEASVLLQGGEDQS